LAVATAAPQFRAISEVVNSQTGEVIPVDVNNQDIAGCLVGPSGERVCPLVAVGSDGRSQVSARGNRGPGLTGSNGNAGPVNAAGQAYDPAAETYKKQLGRTSLRPGSTSEADCSVPVCVAGQFLNATDNQCQACPIGTFQPEEQQTQCIECPANTSTDDVGIVGNVGATSRKQCTNPCTNQEQLCDKNAHCWWSPNIKAIKRYMCTCKQGYKGNGTIGSCVEL